MGFILSSAASSSASAPSPAAAPTSISTPSACLSSILMLVWVLLLLGWLICVGALSPLLALFLCFAAAPSARSLVRRRPRVCVLSDVLLGRGHVDGWWNLCGFLFLGEIRRLGRVISPS